VCAININDCIGEEDLQEADAFDDQILDGEDGLDEDISDMPDHEYAKHKIRLILRVVRPQQVLDAVAGISMGFFAVLATLKIKLAKAVTLGSALGSICERIMKTLFLETFQELAGDHKEWVLPILQYSCRFKLGKLQYA